MKLAIACMENHLQSYIDPHFGRADWYCIYNTEDDSHAFIENPNRYDKEKAGCSAADILIGNNINMVVAGRFGTKVSEVFRANDVQMIVTQEEMTIKNIIKKITRL